MSKGTFTVVGTGLRVAMHLTPEALAAIRRSDRFFYLVYDRVTERWLSMLKPGAISLRRFYKRNTQWRDCCDRMVDEMLLSVKDGFNVCAGFGGHPAVCVYPSGEAIRRAREEGFEATMLPAVSTVDCLFADLGVDPGNDGCRMFDVNEFLSRKPMMDPHTGLILFQVGAFRTRRALSLLRNVLAQTYPAKHSIVVYDAPLIPTWKAVIRRVPLSSLASCRLSFVSTLYIPPSKRARVNRRMAERLAWSRTE